MNLTFLKFLFKNQEKKYALLQINAFLLFIFIIIYCCIPNKHFHGLDSKDQWSFTSIREKIYFTVITHSTVGYGDYHLKDAFQLITAVHLLLLLGINIFIAAGHN